MVGPNRLAGGSRTPSPFKGQRRRKFYIRALRIQPAVWCGIVQTNRDHFRYGACWCDLAGWELMIGAGLVRVTSG